MNIHVQVFVWTYPFISLGKIPKSGMAGSYGSCVFNCSRSCLFSKEFTPFDVGFLSHLLVYSICVLGDLQDISLQVTGVTDPLSLKRKQQQSTRITSYSQPKSLHPLLKKRKGLFFKLKRSSSCRPDTFSLQFYYFLLPVTDAFSSINEKIRIILINMLIESKC